MGSLPKWKHLSVVPVVPAESSMWVLRTTLFNGSKPPTEPNAGAFLNSLENKSESLTLVEVLLITCD